MFGHGFGPSCGSVGLSPLAHSDWSAPVQPQCLGPLVYGLVHCLCALPVCAACARCMYALPTRCLCFVCVALHAACALLACAAYALCLRVAYALCLRAAYALCALPARCACCLCMLPSEAHTASDRVVTKSLPTICFPSSPHGRRANPMGLCLIRSCLGGANS